MKDYFGFEFFEDRTDEGRNISGDFAVSGGDSFDNKPILVYGSIADGTEEAALYGNDGRRKDDQNDPRALGFTFLDCPYANPDFDIDNITYVRRWIKEPWRLPTPDDPNQQIKKELLPDNPNDIHTY
jgi:hypothetical protein